MLIISCSSHSTPLIVFNHRTYAGIILYTNRREEHNILLYQINGFYVEVFYYREYNVSKKIQEFFKC